MSKCIVEWWEWMMMEKKWVASPLWNHMRKWRHYMSFLKSLEKIRISKGSLFEIMKVIFSFIISILIFQILNRVIFLFKNFRLKKFCKNIKFYFRPSREIVSKVAKELYMNWGNKKYPCSIHFLLPFFFYKINSILKNFDTLTFFSRFFIEEFL